MRVRVLLFAALAESVGRAEFELDLPAGATVADAVDALAREHAPIADARDRLAAAVNLAYVKPDHPLAPGDELALIPPVSGG